MKNKPLVSVIIINFKGKDFLINCINSVLNNNYKNIEIVVLDNCSDDGSLEKAKSKFFQNNKIRFIKNVKNAGVASGRNLAISNSKGKYILNADYDTELEQSAIKNYVEFMEENKDAGLLQGKIMKMRERNRFAYAGDYLGPFGFLIERARGVIDEGQFDEACEIFGVNGASMMIRRSFFDEVNGFDDEFVMYLEEPDLCCRIHLLGKKVFYLSDANIWHHDSVNNLKDKSFKESVRNYQGCRNYIWMLVKNLEFRTLLKMLPIHVFCWMIIGFMLLTKGQIVRSKAVFRALLWHVLNIGKVWRSRKLVQNNIRKVKDFNFKNTFSSESISYYFKKAIDFTTSLNSIKKRIG